MRQRGFSLLEVMVAMAILSLSLGVLLEGNIAVIASLQRVDGLTQATLLGRGKMLDIERKLLKEGFKTGDEDLDGDFDDEGHPDIKWSAKIHEIKVATEKLTEFASAFAGGGEGAAAATGGLDPLALIQPILDPIAGAIAQNLRVVVLEVSWPEGKRRGSFKVTSMVTSKTLQQAIPTIQGESK